MVDVLLATCRPNPAFLSAQVDSIRAQKGVDVNIIRREDESGQGASANFSALLAESRSPYVAFSDQDDVWHEEKLTMLMESIVSLESRHGRETPILVFCDSIVTDAGLRPMSGTFLSRQNVNVACGMAFPRILMQNFIAGNLMLFNAALREKAGEVPAAALMHDSWIALVAAAFGVIGRVDMPLVNYRQHGGNAVGATMSAGAKQRTRAVEGVDAFRRRLAENIAQAQAFVDRFGDEAPEAARMLASFPSMGWAARRGAIVRYGLWKHGIFRNLALLAFA